MRVATSLLTILTACQPAADPCMELERISPRGLTLAEEPDRCAEILNFARVVSAREGMTFQAWLDVVSGQVAVILMQTIGSLTDRSESPPVSFGPEPSIPIPCGGKPIGDADWKQLHLSTILTAQPERLYVASRVTIEGNVATITVTQDFDCDGVTANTVLRGEFSPGKPALAGGWKLLESSMPPLDE
jgi:hypothetical protein